MNIADLPKLAMTGDVLLVHGQSNFQRVIQLDTVSPFCHVAMIVVPQPGMLVVCEMVEEEGYQSMLIADWFAGRPNDNIFFGRAPAIVRQNGKIIENSLQEYAVADKRAYGYGELLKVWLSQFTGVDYETKHEVCSLFCAHRWEIAGYRIPGCPSPGDFLFHCRSVCFMS